MRKLYLLTFLFFCLVLIVLGQEKSDSWRKDYFTRHPMQIGNRVQFLFDDYIVEDKYGLKRIVGPVEKYPGNPLDFGAFNPWELYPNLDGSNPRYQGIMLSIVVYDPKGKLFKGWYVIRRTDGFKGARNHSTLYVESKDGIHWVKPELDFFPIDGQKTNIVLYEESKTPLTTAHLQDVVLDTLATNPDRRFIGLVSKVPPGETDRCIVVMYSPDGKNGPYRKMQYCSGVFQMVLIPWYRMPKNNNGCFSGDLRHRRWSEKKSFIRAEIPNAVFLLQ